MTLKTNRGLTNEIASPKKFIPDAKSKDFTRKQTQAFSSININFNPIDINDNFDFTNLKMKKKLHTNTTTGEPRRNLRIFITRDITVPKLFG